MIEEQAQLKSKIDVATKTIDAGLSMLQINKDAARDVWKVHTMKNTYNRKGN